MSSYSTALPTHRVQRLRRQDMIALSLAPQPTNKPTPTSIRSDNLGPLTTTFVPPAHCSRVALRCSTCTDARRGQFCRTQLNGQKSEEDPKCWPTAIAAPIKTPQVPRGALGMYSPGIICPTGYATACARSPSQTDRPDFQFPLEAQETGIGCCPTGYGCGIVGGQQTCTQVVTSTVIDAMTCSGTIAQPLDAFQIPFVQDSKTITEMKLYAPMIQLVHQSTDLLPETTISQFPTVTSSFSTQKPSSTLSPSNPQEAQFFDDSNKLSKTEISGIVVACLILFLCLLSIIGYCIIRKTRPHLVPVIFSPASTRSKEKSKGLRDSSSSTSSLTSTSPMATPKVHALNAFTTPIGSSSPHDPHHKHFSAYQLGIPQKDQQSPMARTDGNGQIVFDTEAARFGRSLGVEDDLESPIDGTSPFRLKRGNTLKGSKLKRVRSNSRPKRSISERSVSPLSRHDNGMEEWDAIITEGSLDRHVSAVTEPQIRQTGLRKAGTQAVPQNVALGNVPAHVPEMQRTVGDMGTYRSHKAKMSVAGPGAPGAGVAM